MAACTHLAIKLFGSHSALERLNELPDVRRARRLAARVRNHAEALLVIPELDAPTSEGERKTVFHGWKVSLNYRCSSFERSNVGEHAQPIALKDICRQDRCSKARGGGETEYSISVCMYAQNLWKRLDYISYHTYK